MPRRSAQPRQTRDAYSALESQAHLLDVIHGLALEILRQYSLEELLWLVAKSTIAKLGFEDCVIYLLDERRQVLVQRAAFGPKSPEGETIVNPIEIPVGVGIVGTVAQTMEAELVVDVRRDARYIVDDQARRSELAVPIVHEERLLGVIDSEHSEPGFYSQQHKAMLTIIASMASSKIAAALTIEQLNATVSELEQARNALRREEQRFRDLYNKHPSMFFSVDETMRIVSANDYACQQLGLTKAEVESRRLSEVIHRTGERSVEAEVRRCIAQPNHVHRWEGKIMHADGKEHWLRLTARALVSDGDRSPSVLIVAEDFTETRDLSLELEFNATHDWLTGLNNRREFERLLKATIEEDRGTGAENALCFIDLDQFKVINDTCGHAAGDTLLRHISRCFQEHVRRTDVVARIGGDEFGILMRDCSIADARRSAKTLIQAIADEPFRWNDHVFSVGASIGISALSVGEGAVDDVLSAADAACLSAKEHGRNRVHVYRERDDDISKRKGESRWVSRINRCLSEDAFELYYQPIRSLNDAASGEYHAEILLRMHDESGGQVLPDAFMPAAERYGLAVRLDQWVVERSFSWIARIGHHLAPSCRWGINLSGATVGDYEFLDFLIDTLRSSGAPATSLCFEITETAAIADLMRARQFIERLEELGCRFALDDFGSGLSSLAYLKNFPVDFLKIDGVFIRDIVKDPINRAMVRSINDIGHLTGKKTIAEFVHNDAVMRAVKQIGIDFAQGHAVSKAKPLADASSDAQLRGG